MSQAPPTPDRNRHPFNTYDMILQIPEAIQQTLENVRKANGPISRGLEKKTRIYFTGCGTAFFAATLGSQVLALSKATSARYAYVQALELSNYDYPMGEDCAVIGVSHSGITQTTVDALRDARSKGAFTIAITHFEGRPISNVADETLIVGNGPDNSRCHTKCYLTGAVACTHIAINLMLPRAPDVSDRLNDITSELSALPETIGRVLKSVEVDCRRLAKKNCNADRYYFAGTGPNVPNTRETALKIMETCYVPAQGFETEQFLHGPWVSLNKSSLLMVFAPKGRCYNRNVELVRAAKELWAPVIGLVEDNDLELSALCDEVVRLPSLDEYTSPFVNIVPAYLFAYYTCVERGFSPDLLRYTTPEYWQARQIIFPPGTH